MIEYDKSRSINLLTVTTDDDQMIVSVNNSRRIVERKGKGFFRTVFRAYAAMWIETQREKFLNARTT